MTRLPPSPFLLSDGDITSDEPATGTASLPNEPVAGLNSDISDVHEIFYHARKLVDDDHRFVLDEQAFMEAIEEMPLFLRN
jgi:hypothetical protein